MSGTGEHILCAALWVDDGVPYVHQPTPTGLVFCGWRHSACIDQAVATGFGDREQRSGKHQGFLTSENRFVSRKEAFVIAEAAGQLEGRHIHFPPTLCSEDLYG
jgi:hypothetical protein